MAGTCEIGWHMLGVFVKRDEFLERMKNYYYF